MVLWGGACLILRYLAKKDVAIKTLPGELVVFQAQHLIEKIVTEVVFVS